jgi:hypothetical protein
MSEPETWRFTAGEAREAAHEVVQHPSDAPWQRIPCPADSQAANAGVTAFEAELKGLPVSIRGALGRAATNAARLSDDRLQGLAELLQNADDVGADAAYFLVDEHRLLFGHNGGGLTLPDVWSLTIPWLSDKSGKADAVGRFGIGLKTLQSLSETLEVHNGYFHLKLGRSSLTVAEPDPTWPNRPEDAATVFVVPFQSGRTTPDEVADWLESWGDAGLLFLRTLRSVTLLDPAGAIVRRLHVARRDAETLFLDGGRTSRTEVSTVDGRSWLLYARDASSPTSLRAGKAQTGTTAVAVAFPRFAGDQGHVHVGLPVRRTGLPFRFTGQFDPLANRRDIADSEWNLDLLALVAALWLDAALDMFAGDAGQAWAAIPLDAEAESDPLSIGQLHEGLIKSLMLDARLAFADAVRLDGGLGTRHHLGELAFETPDLTGVLSDDDIRELAGTAGVIAPHSRSTDGRWRQVLDDLSALGATTPAVVGAAEAVRLLSVPGKSITFLADLSTAVIAAATADENDLGEQLAAAPCLVLADGSHLSPQRATGLLALLPTGPSQLWTKLGIGSEIHPEYADRPGWRTIADWLEARRSLRRTATDEDALRILAAAGRDGTELSQPLTDEQAEALRAALESMDEADRQAFGPGIGMAVRFEATVYGADGSRTHTHARPADAYLIEKEKNSWSIAARRTPGLVWLHRRYSENLRAETGRAGLGAQRLFRLLGAESVPRLSPLPDKTGYYKHYVHYPFGLWNNAPGSPLRRRKQLAAVGARCTLGDLESPDLEKVLIDIAGEKSAQERRRRANALLGCLSRNWERLGRHQKVDAANPDNGWNKRGVVDAWWISRSASISWLTNGRGRPAAPGDVRFKTMTNEAMHGTDPALYLAEAFDQPAHREVLTALGVEGNPTAAALIDRIAEIRETHLSGRALAPGPEGVNPPTIREVADLAAPLYQALAADVQGPGYQRRIGDIQAAAARALFDRGDGLIITNLGWRRTSKALSGDAIFGDYAPFVPAVKGAEPLWAALGVRGPDADDAKRTLNQLSRKRLLGIDDRQIMLEALRLLARVPSERLGQLRRQRVYVGNGWMSKRPVYAVPNPLLANALSNQIAVWQPGGQLAPLASLVAPLALTTIESSHSRVLHAGDADHDADLTATFKDAVQNLQTDLAVSAPGIAESIAVPWDDFAGFQVAVLPELRVRVDIPGQGSHQPELAAWLDSAAKTFFVSAPDEAGRARSGGFAIASIFDANSRDVAHAWAVAWSEAEDGARAELVVTAAERAAEEKRRREASQAALLNLPGPRRTPGKPTPPGRARDKTGSPTPATSDPRSASHKARKLVDTEDLVLREPAGRILTDTSEDVPSRSSGPSAGPNGPAWGRNLRDPKRDHPKQPSSSGRGPLNYTADERESAGLELLRQVLAADDLTLTDVRHQPNVGADAVDDQGRYYELKVHAGAIPDAVRLEDSQIQRALTSDEFYLVLVGNVEHGRGDPEVRIIHDPLHHLKPEPQGAVQLSGVLSAGIARSWTFTRPPES